MMAPRPTRILYCENNIDGTIGGSYYSLLYLVKGLDKTRFCPIVVFYTPHQLLSAFREAGAETIVWRRRRGFAFGVRLARRYPRFGRPVRIVQRGLNLLAFVGAALGRAYFLLVRRIGLVHLNNSVLRNHDWMLAALLTGKPCVTHERGINERYGRATRFYGSRLAAIVCISDAVRRCLEERGGVTFRNLVTIYNGLDPAAMRVRLTPAEIRRTHGLETDSPLIVMLGNLKAWKGQETLIRAMEILKRSFPSTRCLLVGDTAVADEDYGQAMRTLVRTLGLDQLVVFAGFRRNVADYVNAADVIVHASILPEPFGRVILEAMALRKPVVGSRAGAIPEIVEEGLTGLMFAPGDPAALAEALGQLLADPDESVRLGHRGYERLVERFHIRHNVEATERLYETVIREAT